MAPAAGPPESSNPGDPAPVSATTPGRRRQGLEAAADISTAVADRGHAGDEHERQLGVVFGRPVEDVIGSCASGKLRP